MTLNRSQGLWAALAGAMALMLIVAACGGGGGGEPTATPAAASSFLGTTWRVQEGQLAAPTQGTWTRRGQTDLFDAIWKTPGKSDATGQVAIRITGTQVRIRRLDASGGMKYLYIGRFTGEHQASGNYADDSGTAGGRWSATIEGATAAAPVPPGRVVRPPKLAPAATEQEAGTRIQNAVAKLDPGKPATLNAIESVVAVGRMGVPALLQDLQNTDVIRRWSAAYALTRLAESQDTQALLASLNDKNLTIRTMVAATLLSLGNESGLAVLRQAANSNEEASFSAPPQLLRDYARRVLTGFGKSVSADEGGPKLADTAPTGRGPGHVLLSPQIRPPKSTRLEFVGNGVQIAVDVDFYGAGATQKLIDSWKQGIEQVWSNKIFWKPGVPIKVVVNARIVPEPDPLSALTAKPNDPHQIEVLHLKPHEYHRPFVNSIPKEGDSVGGTWDDQVSGLTAAHEVGHLLGIEDEYYDAAIRDTGQVISYPKPEFADEATGTPSLMWRSWVGSDGSVPEVKPRHSQIILKNLGWDPSDFSSLFGPTPTPRPTVTLVRPTVTVPRVSKEPPTPTLSGSFKYVLTKTTAHCTVGGSQCTVTNNVAHWPLGQSLYYPYSVNMNFDAGPGSASLSREVIGQTPVVRTPPPPSAVGQKYTAAVTWAPLPQEFVPGATYAVLLRSNAGGAFTRNTGLEPGPLEASFNIRAFDYRPDLRTTRGIFGFQIDREVTATVNSRNSGETRDGDYVFRLHPDFVAQVKANPDLLDKIPTLFRLNINFIEGTTGHNFSLFVEYEYTLVRE